AVATGIETIAELADAARDCVVVLEDGVCSTRPRHLLRRVDLIKTESLPGFVSGLPALRVDIDNHDAGLSTGRDSDVGVGIRLPPREDLRLVCRGVLEAMRGQRSLLARNQREDTPAVSCVPECCV